MTITPHNSNPDVPGEVSPTNGYRPYWNAANLRRRHYFDARKILDAGNARYQVVCDDNRNLLPTLEPASIDLVVTLPALFQPAGLFIPRIRQRNDRRRILWIT